MNERTLRHCRRPLPLGIRVIAGAVGVLAGLHYLLSPKNRTKGAAIASTRCNQVTESNAQAQGKKQEARTENTRRDYFSIRRTKSELGYVYWVLKGHGEFHCIVLFDTWREAADEADRRLSRANLNGVSSLAAAAAV